MPDYILLGLPNPIVCVHWYAAEFSWKKLFTISTWSKTFGSIFHGFFPHFNKFEGGIVGVPADFLLDENGNIMALKYGNHFGDTWTVDDILNFIN